MKYFIAKLSQDSSTDAIRFDEPRIVVTKNEIEDEAKAMYSDLIKCEPNTELICIPVEQGAFQIKMEADAFKVCYPIEIECVTVECTSTHELYTGFKIGMIPAKTSPTQRDILEFYYRGNMKRYKDDLQKAKTDSKVRTTLKRINQAVPWDRLILDAGHTNFIIPLNGDYIVKGV